MSGDVFGNGACCCPNIGLVAAFDHRDVFWTRPAGPGGRFPGAQTPLRVVAFELAGLQTRT